MNDKWNFEMDEKTINIYKAWSEAEVNKFIEYAENNKKIRYADMVKLIKRLYMILKLFQMKR